MSEAAKTKTPQAIVHRHLKPLFTDIISSRTSPPRHMIYREYPVLAVLFPHPFSLLIVLLTSPNPSSLRPHLLSPPHPPLHSSHPHPHPHLLTGPAGRTRLQG